MLVLLGCYTIPMLPISSNGSLKMSFPSIHCSGRIYRTKFVVPALAGKFFPTKVGTTNKYKYRTTLEDKKSEWLPEK